MSELKAYIAPTPDGTGLADYYLKSEADKVIAEKDKEIAELKMKLAGAKRNCKNCLQCHEIEDKGSFYKVFCKQVGHWVMWNKEDNCTEFLPKEDE